MYISISGHISTNISLLKILKRFAKIKNSRAELKPHLKWTILTFCETIRN